MPASALGQSRFDEKGSPNRGALSLNDFRLIQLGSRLWGTGANLGDNEEGVRI